MKFCDRCKRELKDGVHVIGYFNLQILCKDCQKEEMNHPDYEEAKRVEYYEVFVKGNRNFEGIGLPEDLRRKYNLDEF